MTKWAKIDRANGAVLKYKHENSLTRSFNKPTIWLEVETLDKAAFNPDTHKVVEDIRQSDLSDLSLSVNQNEKRVEAWQIAELSDDEKAHEKAQKIARTDVKLSAVVEDIMVAIATNATLSRDTFSKEVWEKINARREIRGEDAV